MEYLKRSTSFALDTFKTFLCRISLWARMVLIFLFIAALASFWYWFCYRTLREALKRYEEHSMLLSAQEKDLALKVRSAQEACREEERLRRLFGDYKWPTMVALDKFLLLSVKRLAKAHQLSSALGKELFVIRGPASLRGTVYPFFLRGTYENLLLFFKDIEALGVGTLGIQGSFVVEGDEIKWSGVFYWLSRQSL